MGRRMELTLDNDNNNINTQLRLIWDWAAVRLWVDGRMGGRPRTHKKGVWRGRVRRRPKKRDDKLCMFAVIEINRN